jgi:hypothetical protein
LTFFVSLKIALLLSKRVFSIPQIAQIFAFRSSQLLQSSVHYFVATNLADGIASDAYLRNEVAEGVSDENFFL